jgi:hypothetical protein
MSEVTNVMIYVADDEPERNLAELSRMLEEMPRTDGRVGVGSLRPLTAGPGEDAWGGEKAPECTIWAGALNHADIMLVLLAVVVIEWEQREVIQIFAKRSEDQFFRVWMLRHGDTELVL